MEMPPESKVTPLPISPRCAPPAAGCCRPVTDNDQRRRLARTRRHAEQGAHAELLHPLAIQDLALQALLRRHPCGVSGKQGRGQPVAGLIHELPREILRFGHDAASRQGLLMLGKGFREHQREAVHGLPLVLVLRLVAVCLEVAEQGALDGGGDVLRRGETGV